MSLPDPRPLSPESPAPAPASLVDGVLASLDRSGDTQAAARAAGLSRKQAARKFPTRLTRYLIPVVWMERLRDQLGRPLRVCEIGTGSGQMRTFVDFMAASLPGAHKPLWQVWHGFDIAPQKEKLARAGYDVVEELNADEPLQREFRGYDVVLLLHVLEHLKDPEESFPRLAAACDPETAIIIGVPASAEFLARYREEQLRKKYLPGGHWCKFSPVRLRRLMASAGLGSTELSGAFFLRASGLFLEDYRWWFRLNLQMAGLFSWWPGEVYCRGTTGTSTTGALPAIQ